MEFAIKFCPSCGGEFRHDVEICHDCEVELVHQAPATRYAAIDGAPGSRFDPRREQEIVLLAQIESEQELLIVKSVLTGAGIDFEVHGEPRLLGGGRPTATRIFVRAADREAAVEILAGEPAGECE